MDSPYLQHLEAYDLGMSSEEAASRFEELQKKLVPLWHSIRAMNQDEQTIVVVPSLTLDVEVPPSLLQAYEERFLFLLLLLRQPRARLVYVSSQAVRTEVVDYYLHLLPGVIASQARKRLYLVSPLDGSGTPLTLKILKRPNLIRLIRSLITDPDRAHLVPFLTTRLERDLALQLGIPMYGADPKHLHFGTKSGCRRLFAEEGVNHPLGEEGVTDAPSLVRAIANMRAQRSGMEKVIIKHNEGVSGMGNAVLDLSGLPAPGAAEEQAALLARLPSMRFEVPEITYEWYMQKLAQQGGIAEERISGTDFRSPSAQLRITPLGEVELLSTHDQWLGGPSGQTYLGACFPADSDYAVQIMQEAAKVGKRLAKEGVLGRFAIDFVAVRNQDSRNSDWQTYAIELNLRKGGTTHPFLTLQFLTDGKYEAESGLFLAPRGHCKFFVASDHLESPSYRVFTPDDIFEIIALRGLHFDQSRQAGVVFHMLSALGEFGRLGVTAVGNSREEATAFYERTVEALNQAALQALA